MQMHLYKAVDLRNILWPRTFSTPAGGFTQTSIRWSERLPAGTTYYLLAPLRPFSPSLRNVPSRSSVNAWRSSSCVFITMGPYQATGSSSGLPETRRKRIPSSLACTTSSSPRSNRTSERFSASEGGAVSSHPTGSVGTASGPDALQNLPAPAKT